MSEPTFRALVMDRPSDSLTIELRSLPLAALPEGEVTVAVEYSSINYKDALILAEKGYRAQFYPMVPGIDLAGRVVDSRDPAFQAGDRVVLNGAGLGETRWGGYAESASVPAGSLVHLPATLSTRDAMAIGTAGLAAALAVLALEESGMARDSGSVLVTGAAGGVGSMAVALLAERGYHVTASSGRPSTCDYLRLLGASDIVGRLEASGEAPLQRERWSGAIDTVGGAALPAVLSEMKYGTSVAAAGFAGGMTTALHLAPLLARAVRLIGINTSLCPVELRRRAWTFLADWLPRDAIEISTTVVSLAEVPETARALLAGAITGRIVVEI